MGAGQHGSLIFKQSRDHTPVLTANCEISHLRAGETVPVAGSNTREVGELDV